MSRPSTLRHIALVALAGAAFWMGSATAAPAAAAAGTPPVTVNYVDPQHFTENQLYGMQDHFNDVDYLQRLKAYLIKQGARQLAPGQHLNVTITDIKLAGGYEPGVGPRWQYVRFMTDVYPPRIDLSFRLTGADGTVLKQGSRRLSDLSYLSRGLGGTGNEEPLRYDKALLDRWLRQEFRSGQ